MVNTDITVLVYVKGGMTVKRGVELNRKSKKILGNF